MRQSRGRQQQVLDQERKIDWGFEAESIWCLESLWHRDAGNQGFNEGFRLVFKAWPGFR